MATVDYAATIQRILDILQKDETLEEEVSEWRFGELPEQTDAYSFPAVYVTTAENPQVERIDMTPARDDGETMPIQKITTEYWVVIVTNPDHASPSDAQKQMYALQNRIIGILKRSLRLRNPAADQNDTRADYLRISSQPRLTSMRGKTMTSMTIMVRVTNFE